MKATFDGDVLVLPRWSFAAGNPRVPHRSSTLAFWKAGAISYFVSANRNETLFWVRAVGPGFAGDFSRYSHTVTTRKRELAELWIKSVTTGKVTVAEQKPKP